MIEYKTIEELFKFLTSILQYIFLVSLFCYLLVIFDTIVSIDFVEEEELEAAFIDNISRNIKRSWKSYSQPEILYLCLKFYIRETWRKCNQSAKHRKSTQYSPRLINMFILLIPISLQPFLFPRKKKKIL